MAFAVECEECDNSFFRTLLSRVRRKEGINPIFESSLGNKKELRVPLASPPMATITSSILLDSLPGTSCAVEITQEIPRKEFILL